MFAQEGKKKRGGAITAGRAKDAPFPASTQDPLLVLLLRSHRSVYLPWLSTLTALLCKQMFLLRCQSLPFSAFGEGILLRERLQKWQETTETTSLLLHPRRMWERGRVVRRQQLSFFFFFSLPPSSWRNTVESDPRAASKGSSFIYHTCDALFWATKTHDRDTDGHGTAGGYVLRKKKKKEKGLGRCEKKRRY